MVAVSINFRDEDYALLEDCAEQYDISVSEFIRRTMFERLEDEEDIRDALAAYEECLKNPELLVDFKELKDEWLK